jgi:methyltransferase-like protein
MADRHPDSSYLGVDYSARQIETGRQAIGVLGLTNIELAHRSILDLGSELGTFDYIICHGVYSWVTPELQDKILSTCRACLAPHGVVYLSYNVYPAWHLRSVLRDVAGGAASAELPLDKRVGRMRAALEFLGGALADEATAYANFLKDDVAFVLAQPDNYLVHEYLEDESRPVYFHEFEHSATAHGLQYLGDAQLWMMFPANLGAKVAHNLAQFTQDPIAGEQYLDVLWNRSFRNSVLCRGDLHAERHFAPANLRGLYFYGELQPENMGVDPHFDGIERFVTPRGISIATASPVAKAALRRLGTRWPAAVSFEELLAASGADPSGEDQGLADALLQCLATGIIEARFAPDSFVAAISPRPSASRMAQAQASVTPKVTNRRHEVVLLDEVAQNTLAHLDGRHDRAALTGVLREAMDRGRLSIYRNGIPLGRGEVADGILDAALDGALATLAKNAFLVS